MQPTNTSERPPPTPDCVPGVQYFPMSNPSIALQPVDQKDLDSGTDYRPLRPHSQGLNHQTANSPPDFQAQSIQAPVFEDDDDTSSLGVPNIIVFGETGTGKSSLINMLLGAPVASTSSGAVGETFLSKGYDVTIDDRTFRLWDTAGMNEGNKGTIPADKALENLRDLAINLQGGVNLLLYCIRGGRYGDILRVNYDMFHGIICQGRVPIVLVITGLEQESPMESWWEVNKQEFVDYDLHFFDHACVTTSRGKKMKDGFYSFQEEYDASKEAIKHLVLKNCPGQGWSLTSQEWIAQIGWRMANYMIEFNRRSGNERQALQEDYAGRREAHPHPHFHPTPGAFQYWQPADRLEGAQMAPNSSIFNNYNAFVRFLRMVSEEFRSWAQDFSNDHFRPTHNLPESNRDRSDEPLASSVRADEQRRVPSTI